ncbi:hypothetical protein B4135_3961 [Caldibacillus debilis]|uniref:Uncharacterized protein n=1 Tax=Caldibacillus debilis TaxID=301148 RepID=A0A150L9Y0_9BACI|nr:hypothetical protein B4135_3961 [Caldibacillus debilis]
MLAGRPGAGTRDGPSPGARSDKALPVPSAAALWFHSKNPLFGKLRPENAKRHSTPLFEDILCL